MIKFKKQDGAYINENYGFRITKKPDGFWNLYVEGEWAGDSKKKSKPVTQAAHIIEDLQAATDYTRRLY